MIEWSNKWMNKWMNEWINEWMNEWMNEWQHLFYKQEEEECQFTDTIYHFLSGRP